MNLTIGIDASNLRSGGGVTHLIELLTMAEPSAYGIKKVVVWGGHKTLDQLPARDWLEKLSPNALNGGLLQRIVWVKFGLANEVRKASCDILFVPGGLLSGNFRPVVTMSRNLLPFEWTELRRYGFRFTTLRLLVLRYLQSRSFKRSDGVIFLTSYARDSVLRVTGPIAGMETTIPHGISSRFRLRPKDQQHISCYSETNPYRLIYVSIIDQYKHQWCLIEAVSSLRALGYPLILDLVGPSNPISMRRLRASIVKFDPDNLWVRYHGAVPYETLNVLYAEADLGVFASSCENLPNILLEVMAAALPIVSSNRGPMPEVLGEGGIYFDPENPIEITHALRKYLESPDLRTKKLAASIAKSEQYTWERCADATLAFLVKTISEE